MKKIPKENIKDVLRKTYSDVEYLKVTYNNDYIIVKFIIQKINIEYSF